MPSTVLAGIRGMNFSDRGERRRQRRQDLGERLDVVAVGGRNEDWLVRKRRQPRGDDAVDDELVALLHP
jgi:hypothetical protein